MKSKLLIPYREIQVRTQILGQGISNYFKDCGGLQRVVIVLKGAAMFAQGLLPWLPYDVELSYITAKSYHGKAQRSAEKVDISHASGHRLSETSAWEDFTLPGENILVVEDIVDTGHTLKAIFDRMKAPGITASVSLLNKPSRRVEAINPDWYGFEIPDVFVYGHGLDLDEKHRGQPNVLQCC